jgi:uncharacterized phage protein (TIGR02218 family)
MRNVSAALRILIDQEGTNLCRLWTITLVNGETLRFTDLNSNVLRSALVYYANPGITVSAIQTELNGGPSDASINVTLNPLFLTKEMARRGSLDRATVDIIAIDYLNPLVGSIPLFNGIVREVGVFDNGACSLDVGGNLAKFDRGLLEYYSETCRNVFGDADCGIDVEALGKDFTVVAVDTRGGWFEAFELDEADRFWNFGTAKFETGNSTGQTYEIGRFVQNLDDGTGRAHFLLKTRFRVEIGDTGRIYPGCTKWLKLDCKDRFDNVGNFRGEPFVPNLSFTTSSDIVTKVTSKQTGTITEQVLVSSEPGKAVFSWKTV